MSELETLVAEWLPGQRWFGGKGRTLEGVSLELAATCDGGRPLQVYVATVHFQAGPDELYLVPLTSSPDPVAVLEHALVGYSASAGHVFDGTHDKDAAGRWLELIADRVECGALHGHHEDDDEPLEQSLPSRVIGAEQSNTSIVYGDSYILKLFRKLSAGVNPDLEIGRALAAVDCPHVLRPLGWLDLRLGAQTATAGLLQPYLRSATDGWAMAVTSVRDLYAEADLHADEVGGDFAGEARRLGAATATVHAGMARALPSGLAGPEESAATAKQMHERLDAALEVVPQLAEFADALRAVYDELASLSEPVPVQRVHGDFHLGQVMRTDSGWVLFDFEGEPARTLAERTALMSPLRDVAGMLRSFDYAARHLLADHPASPALEYRAMEWSERNRAAFCEGYGQQVGTDPRDSAVLLRAFELDKAVYEVVYEARNRPSWLGIPLGSITRLVG